MATNPFLPQNLGISGYDQSSGYGGKQSMFDPNNQTHTQGMQDLQSSLKGMISSGNESGAKALYGQKQNEYGFTDAQYSPFALNGAGDGTFTADQINAWKQNTAPTPQAGTGTFYDNNKGTTAPTVDPYQKNPYLDQMAQGIQSQMNENWTRNQLPSIRSGAMAAGGFGGSRQGVVEANGLNDMNRSLGQNLTNLYGGDYQQTQNRNLQKYGMDQGYNLGMANNNLGYANLDSNNAQFGANFGLQSQDAQNRWANNNVNTANAIQNTPINYFNGFNQNANQIAGQGGSTSQTNQGNPFLSGLGGMQIGNQIWGKP